MLQNKHLLCKIIFVHYTENLLMNLHLHTLISPQCNDKKKHLSYTTNNHFLNIISFHDNALNSFVNISHIDKWTYVILKNISTIWT